MFMENILFWETWVNEMKKIQKLLKGGEYQRKNDNNSVLSLFINNKYIFDITNQTNQVI